MRRPAILCLWVLSTLALVHCSAPAANGGGKQPHVPVLETPFRLNERQMRYGYLWATFGNEWAECLCFKALERRTSNQAVFETGNEQQRTQARQANFDHVFGSGDEVEACRGKATEKINQEREGDAEQLTNVLKPYEHQIMDLHRRFEFSKDRCMCYFWEVESLWSSEPIVDDDPALMAAADEYARECEAAALDANLPLHFRHWPYELDALQPSQRLLDIVQQRRSSPGRAGRSSQPPPPFVASARVSGKARLLRLRYSGADGGGLDTLSGYARQMTHTAARAGAAKLGALRDGLGQLQRDVRRYGFGGGALKLVTPPNQHVTGAGGAGNGGSRSANFGAKLLPSLPSVGHR